MIESSRPIRTIIGQYANYVLAALPLRNFLPKVTMSITKGEFLIKTAENWKDVESVLKLRYEVFLREGLNLNFPLGMDVDRWDPLADHLMVIDTRNQTLIGTYRLVSSSFSNDFYSASEFELGPFLKSTLGGKLELSRACIRAEYRSTAAISLLWRGIAAYANVVGARYLFGCASIKSTDRHVADTLLDYFKGEGLYEEKAGVHPLPAFQMPAAAPRTDPAAAVNVREMIPPLLGSYLRAGAKVLCEPALDRSFKCLDFLTVLDFTNINKAFERRYLSS